MDVNITITFLLEKTLVVCVDSVHKSWNAEKPAAAPPMLFREDQSNDY